ncbi:MarR family winged helix-turn-helix transcriptional regulator [Teichococcus aerofrigidensis]
MIARTEMDRVKVSRAVIRLDGKALIRREPLPGDRRAPQLRLSRRGEALYRRIVPRARALQAELAGALSAGGAGGARHHPDQAPPPRRGPAPAARAGRLKHPGGQERPGAFETECHSPRRGRASCGGGADSPPRQPCHHPPGAQFECRGTSSTIPSGRSCFPPWWRRFLSPPCSSPWPS